MAALRKESSSGIQAARLTRLGDVANSLIQTCAAIPCWVAVRGDAPGYVEALQIVAEARSTTSFLLGNFDRAVPLLLYTNFYSTNDWPTFIRNGARLCYCPESVEETLKRGYERELKVIGRTGITRDGWCYIIVYAAVGKVMVDFMVVTITRFLAPGLTFSIAC